MNDARSHAIMAVDPDEDLPETDIADETIQSALDSDDGTVRVHAARVAAELARDDPDRVVSLTPALADALGDDERTAVTLQSGIALACVAESAPDPLEPAVPEFVAMLSHEFSEIRELSARALATVVQDRREYFVDHVDALLAAAAQEPEDVLDRENEPVSPRKPPGADNPTDDVNREKRVQQILARETAANLVAETAEHDAGSLEPHVPALVDLLSDPNLGVATAAADALGSVAGENPPAVDEAVDPLVALLDEDDEPLVATAVRALGFAGDPAAVPDLRDLAADESRDEDLRDLAAETADFLDERDTDARN